MTGPEPADDVPAVPSPAPPHTLGESDIKAEFTTFYRDVIKQVVGFLVLQGAQLADAVDLAQDTLAILYRRWRTVDHPRAWTFRVASRALVRKVANIPEDPVDQVPVHSPLLRANADIDHWEQQTDIIRVLNRLPPRQRQVMAWTVYGYTPTEIAHELSIDPSTVRANLWKARRALAIYITGTEDDQ